MSEQLYNYDPAEALDGPDAIAAFVADAFETGDAAYIAKAIGVAARAKGMTAVGRESGLAREQLYSTFSQEGNPTLKSMLAVLRVLEVDLTARPHVR